MEERTGAEYIGEPPPSPYPEDTSRRHRIHTDNTDMGAMRVRGGEWTGISGTAGDINEGSGNCRPSGTDP